MAGGINAYLYVPNPTGWIDPLGLSCNIGNCPGSVLDTHEKAGRHLIKKHVAQTRTQLTARLNFEPHIPAASTFKNQEEAEALVSKSLNTHRHEILKFLEGKKGQIYNLR
nr:RNase A-like domain-containing protein [Pseudomonas lurida]